MSLYFILSILISCEVDNDGNYHVYIYQLILSMTSIAERHFLFKVKMYKIYMLSSWYWISTRYKSGVTTFIENLMVVWFKIETIIWGFHSWIIWQDFL